MSRKVRGVGVNDIGYVGAEKAYSVWFDMLTRCYNNKTRRKHHMSYIDCIVCDEWLVFSSFNKWDNINYKEGFELDKDVMGSDNKLYSPESCSYVPKEVNRLFNTRVAARGDCPIGVTFNKEHKKYYSQITINGTTISIGQFDNANDAHLSYIPVKNEYLRNKLQKHALLGNISKEYADKAYDKFSLKISNSSVK